MAFDGHYEEWRLKRIRAIVEHYGAEWFRGKKLLELRCGYGDIGAAFWTLGADVVFVEGRREHVKLIRERFPMIASHKIIAADMNRGLNLVRNFGRFDLIVHLGLLYHLDHWQRSIAECGTLAPLMVLETEVADSDDPTFELKVKEEGYDQALGGTGTRPSADFVERTLENSGWNHERLRDSRCNAAIHRYDWTVKNTGTWEHGLRRFWWCSRS